MAKKKKRKRKKKQEHSERNEVVYEASRRYSDGHTTWRARQHADDDALRSASKGRLNALADDVIGNCKRD